MFCFQGHVLFPPVSNLLISILCDCLCLCLGGCLCKTVFDGDVHVKCINDLPQYSDGISHVAQSNR